MKFLSRRGGRFFASAVLVSTLLAAPCMTYAQSLAPFGADAKPPASGAPKAMDVAPVAVDAFAPSMSSAWAIDPPPAAGAPLFTLGQEDGKNALTISAGDFTPKTMTLRAFLPGEAADNGDAWAKAHASYITFQCKSTKPAKLTFHLLMHGKSPGTYSVAFDASPGAWQTITVPYQNFGLRNFGKIAGLGFRVASAEKGTQVTIAGVTVGGAAYSDDSFKARHVSISLKGDWKFATDDGDQGMKDQWYAENFDDAGWKVLKSGATWQEQGVEHHGYGWYRQKIVVPKEMTGVPLTLTLSREPEDDDFWFNGVRIGGWNGEYKYENQIVRTYTVPAALIHYGEPNTMATRIWGGELGFIGDKSGLTAGPLAAEMDPYYVSMRAPGGAEAAAQNFDLSDAQQGKPFEMIFRFPPEIASGAGAQLRYRITDFDGGEIASGTLPLAAAKDQPADAPVQAVVPINRDAAQLVYLRGRIKANLMVQDAAGNSVYSTIKVLDHLCFQKRDDTALPALPETVEDTPYGKLKLVDEIDCSTSIFDEVHPYTQSGFEHSQDRMPPGAAVDVQVNDILGKKGREAQGGWFAYRIGRGGLKAHSTYLLRIEYPEDKPRYCPLEIQVGQTFMDIGWKNGVSPTDVYDNWPLSHKWQWYDAIVPTDIKTAGNGGAGSSKIENGFWVYFMNEVHPDKYLALYSGGPAIARMKLYEIDPVKNAPVIHLPEGLPHRVLGFDWERQADHEPGDLVNYAKLMGYSAISPIILKWGMSNYAEPLNGYDTVNMDAHTYWSQASYDPASGKPAVQPIPGRASEHVRYLEATKRMGIDYIPRIEYGGSYDLPVSARAIGVDGKFMKPDRFATWGANLLDPATWDDMKKLLDSDIKPYVKDNPQLKGILWRIRQDRMPISYGKNDIALFCKETGATPPAGGDAQAAAWAAGENKVKYDDWWHQKREEFHAKLVDLLKSYRSDMSLYYYNWDGDKFCLISPDINSWGFLINVAKATPPDGARAAYEADRKQRASYTAADYIAVMHTGNFGDASKGVNRADYGIRPELYKDVKGMQIFAPVDYLCYANLPDYLNYFQMPDGLAVTNVVSYDELSARSINPKYEGVMISPAGAPFSMALELLAYFHGDARTINYTPYTYGRGFADAHRRFAQAFLALPAIKGTVVDQGDPDLKVRTYPSANGTYVGVAYRGYQAKKLTIKIPCDKAGATLQNLVTGENVPATAAGGNLQFDIDSGPMELNAYLIH